MNTPLVLIITGPPGAGKTTLGRELARRLSLPFIDKDSMKEILYDALGWKDREWSQKLGAASFGLLYHGLERQLEAGASVVVETAFAPELDNARFNDLKKKYTTVRL